MLVVADQQTLGVGGQSGLAGSGKAEEDSGVLAVHIGVGGAVHGSDALERQVVVHHGEHTLLHLTAVPGVHDYLLAAGNVEHSGSLGIQAQLFVVFNLRLGSVVYNKIRSKALKLLIGGLYKHVLNEVGLPSHFNDETDRHAGILVGPTERIYDKKSLVGKLFQRDFLHGIPCFLTGRVVIVLIFIRGPPYGILGILVHNDEFILGRTPRIDTGHNINRAKLTHLSLFIAFQGRFGLLLEQCLIRRIVDNFCGSGDAVLT